VSRLPSGPYRLARPAGHLLLCACRRAYNRLGTPGDGDTELLLCRTIVNHFNGLCCIYEIMISCYYAFMFSFIHEYMHLYFMYDAFHGMLVAICRVNPLRGELMPTISLVVYLLATDNSSDVHAVK
jgi:hypothetical protein